MKTEPDQSSEGAAAPSAPARGRRASIGDIARALGVSKSTVSYALNGKRGVGEGTRRRVLRAARQLQWSPNQAARALSRSRAGAIGVILARDPSLLSTEAYYMSALSGIEAELERTGTALLLRMVRGSKRTMLEAYRCWSTERRVDGVIMFDLLEDDPRVPLVRSLQLPTVVQGPRLPSLDLPSVATDDMADAHTLVRHLAELGHTRLLQVCGPAAYLHEGLRRRGAEECARTLGVQLEHISCAYSEPQASRAVSARIAAGAPPTGIICSSDLIAIGAARAALRHGLRVGTDVSVVSWDDSVLCRTFDPPITALERRTADCGMYSARILLREIQGDRISSITLPPSLLRRRRSSGRLRRQPNGR